MRFFEEAVKWAVGLGIVVLLDPLLGGLMPPVLAIPLSVLVSAAILAASLNFLFVRPILVIDWYNVLTHMSPAGPQFEGGRVLPGGQIGQFDISVNARGRYWLAGRLLRAIAGRNAILSLEFSAAAKIDATDQSAIPDPSVLGGDDEISFTFGSSTHPGEWSQGEFTLSALAPTARPQTIGIKPVLNIQGPGAWWLKKFISLETNITAVTFGRA